MKIGELIRNYRVKQNLTSKQVGDAIGLSAQAICQYERGTRSIRDEVLEQLIELLKISSEDLDNICDVNDLNEGNKIPSSIINDGDTSIISEHNNLALNTAQNNSVESSIVNLYENVLTNLGYGITLNLDCKNNTYSIALTNLDDGISKNLTLEDFTILKSSMKNYLDFNFHNLHKKY